MSHQCCEHQVGQKVHTPSHGGEWVVYSCPMHLEVVSDKPGLCPECGMELLPQKQKKGHTHEHSTGSFDKSRFAFANRGSAISQAKSGYAGHSTNIFKTKFWVSLALTIPIFLYSELAETLGIVLPPFEGYEYLGIVLGSVVFFYGGWVFLIGAYRELRARLPGMMTLIALAIVTAYAYSVFVVARGALLGEDFAGQGLFWELASLIAIMLLGHWIEMRAVSGAQGALRELSKLLPDTAEVLVGEKETKQVSLQELAVGMRVLIKPGAKIPADGRVESGESEVNESLLTGESKPVHKKEGDVVIGGAINGDGALVVRIEKSGGETFIAQIIKLVADAQASKSRMQILADRAALFLTAVAVIAGGSTLSVWLLTGAGIVFAVERLVAVLVIACPHALGLAVPLVASISTTMGAQNGVLVKDRRALEAARKIDVVLFDKTGTLTRGSYGVTDIVPAEGFTEEGVLQLAASVNYFSEHLIAEALVADAKQKALVALSADKFERVPGIGAKAFINNVPVWVGSYRIVERAGAVLAPAIRERAASLAREGKSVIFVVHGNSLTGTIALADAARTESREAIARLKAEGVRVAMVTGDAEDTAKYIAGSLGLDEYFAKVLPEEKEKRVRELQKRGLKVAMVGDGVNDAPALAAADVGIAIGAGTNVAIESAGIILVRDDPRDVSKIIALSRRTYAKMVQNLWWAAGYNIVAIPLAAGVLASRDIFLNPAFAAVLMSFSAVIVSANALLFRRKGI